MASENPWEFELTLFWRVANDLSCRHGAVASTAKPSLPVRTRDVANVGDRLSAYALPRRATRPHRFALYYLIPENKVALEAFAVIRDAMRGKSMVALGRVVLSSASASSCSSHGERVCSAQR